MLTHTLADLGWSAHFMQQLDIEALETLQPMRVSAVHRDRLEAIGTAGPAALTLPGGQETGAYAIGDWLMVEPETLRVITLLDRATTLARRAAGTDARQQLLAANVDVMFITTSCNADFNPRRLERYLALAEQAGITPVLVMTKADGCAGTEAREDWRARGEALMPGLAVQLLDARDPAQVAPLTDWWRKGQTAVLLGSSGVGKSTLANTLCGGAQGTGGIREDDAKGRHTTTRRDFLRASHGGWLIDTPGLRALRLQAAEEGIDAVFSDVAELAEQCRFSDCRHEGEPGCAVQAAIAEGRLEADRLRRWQKLRAEDRRNSETIAEARHRDRQFGKIVREAMRERDRRGKS
ncbi:Putative ribosome biogenesis GTPase RsgA [Pseudoruegeria aquimaris]|uniref:Small ribosomal subunit biogenesis GTPase RsgA n=1 Tax=Pseudoruegeria aquimaris TaxID=393663 RepID=A0A1Y5SFU6_9RHOB|nr:ribosome small subunit-dependent GTPase A [Pseudoruegeria aquimaris]SLN39834.1 Putative ribosome biogenesis GTPase RsgA [Pseudoruegeria aquimaris]